MNYELRKDDVDNNVLNIIRYAYYLEEEDIS